MMHQSRLFYQATSIGLSVFLLFYFIYQLVMPSASDSLLFAMSPKTIEAIPATIQLVLSATPLSILMSIIITGIGALIAIYASVYFQDDAFYHRFVIYFLVFMLAMLGIVLSDNIIYLFISWELTSFSSFFLINYNFKSEHSQFKATQALWITASGGLFMLLGLIALGMDLNTFSLSQMILQRHEISSEVFSFAFFMIILGTFSKSALFPFHFWLPNAMVAPTPASGYLHSATMVKAGLFLLFKLMPLLSLHPMWQPLLVYSGLITALIGSINALRSEDIKLMLAHTTLTMLGLIAFLIGFHEINAAFLAIFLLITHAIYKAGLFMVIGIIDHHYHTRNYHHIFGAFKAMPFVFFIILLLCFSLAGFPISLGFMGKELLYGLMIDKAMHLELGVLIIINACMVASAILLAYRLFWKKSPQTQTDSPSNTQAHLTFSWVFPPLLLAVLGIGLAFYANSMAHWIIQPILKESFGRTIMHLHLSLWHGLSIPLILSVFTIIIGFIFYQFKVQKTAWVENSLPQLSMARFYDGTLFFFEQSAQWLQTTFQSGLLNRYVQTLLATFILFLLFVLFSFHANSQALHSLFLIDAIDWSQSFKAQDLIIITLASIGIMCLLALLNATHYIRAFILLSVGGLVISILFIIFSAPDLMQTQFTADILLAVMFAFVMCSSKLNFKNYDTLVSMIVRFLLGLFLALGFVFIALSILTVPFNYSLSEFFYENSLPIGMGRNVVNVILIDFRGFDTFVETSVLMMAGVAIYYATLGKRTSESIISSLHILHSPILKVATLLIAPVLLLVSFYAFLKGHNTPGGGFVGGLLASVAFILYAISHNSDWIKKIFRVSSLTLAGIGVLLICITVVLPVFLGKLPLTALWLHDLHIGTPTLFDFGVYLAVIGAIVGSFIRLDQNLLT